jgi:beta-hydroxylase
MKCWTLTLEFLVLFLLAWLNHRRILDGFNNWLVRPFPVSHKQAFLDVNQVFPEHQLLEKNWKEIQKEALNVLDITPSATKVSGAFFAGLNQQDKWKVFPLIFYGSDNEENLNKCPTTKKLLKQIPRIKSAMFSVMEPGLFVKPHRGPFRGILRYHLGLKVPPEHCFMNLNGTSYKWQEGQDVLLDDTNEHFVLNHSNETRIVLFCDVERDYTEFGQTSNTLQSWINWFIIYKSGLPNLLYNVNAANERAVPVFHPEL